MTLNDAALVLAANAVKAGITHLQLHSDTPGAAGTSNVIGSRVAATATVDSDGDLLWSNVAFTGLGANAAVKFVTYWSASTGGTLYGQGAVTGDATANASGEYTLTSVTETSTSA